MQPHTGITQSELPDFEARITFRQSGKEITHPASLSSDAWSNDVVLRDELQHPEDIVWARIEGINDVNGIVMIPGQAIIEVWDGVVDADPTTLGFYQPLHRLPVRGDPYALPASYLDADTLYLRITPFAQQPYPVRLELLTEDDYWRTKQQQGSSRIGYYMFLGAGVIALLFLMMFALVQYYEHRRKAYLHYAGYVLCMALYFGRLLEYHFGIPVFWGFFSEGYGLAEVVALMLSYIFYIQFARSFLDLDNQLPGLIPLFKVFIWLCFVTAFAGLALSLLRWHSATFWEVHSALKIGMLLVVVYFVWRIARGGIPLSRYVVWGSGFLILGSLLALLTTFVFYQARGQLLGEPMFYMLSGTLLEAFAFAMGLGRLARKAELEKIEVQNALIAKLETERQLEREVHESRIQMLRAQMNPHFIFNALNSIQHFILSNQKEKSVRYLTQVSRLIRRILQNSNERQISLEEEIQTLKAYIEIEQIRFHPAFAYEVSVADDIIAEETDIPQLLIQPIVENAILHGLAPKKEDGLLQLSFEKDHVDRLKVIVEDNGIGRAAAQAVAVGREGHTSISSNAIRDRLAMLMPEVSNALIYEDLSDGNGRPSGTRVTLIIPVIR